MLFFLISTKRAYTSLSLSFFLFLPSKTQKKHSDDNVWMSVCKYWDTQPVYFAIENGGENTNPKLHFHKTIARLTENIKRKPRRNIARNAYFSQLVLLPFIKQFHPSVGLLIPFVEEMLGNNNVFRLTTRDRSNLIRAVQFSQKKRCFRSWGGGGGGVDVRWVHECGCVGIQNIVWNS